MTVHELQLRQSTRWAEHRRWAYYNIGAFMCDIDTGRVHGPHLTLTGEEPMPTQSLEAAHEVMRLFVPAPNQIPGQQSF
jgi:hypothetical protein